MAMGVGLVIGRGDGDIGRKYAVCVVEMPCLRGANAPFVWLKWHIWGMLGCVYLSANMENIWCFACLCQIYVVFLWQ